MSGYDDETELRKATTVTDDDDAYVVGQKTKRRSQATEKETEDFKKLIGTYEGRAFVWRILEKCEVYQTTFTGDALTSAFKEGKRFIGLAVMGEVFTASPVVYRLMQDEADERLRILNGEGT